MDKNFNLKRNEHIAYDLKDKYIPREDMLRPSVHKRAQVQQSTNNLID